jgi:hypothetical protein
MTETLKPEHRGDLRMPMSSLSDESDPAAKLAWLRDRYMKNPRDTLFDEAIQEILETDASGNLTARPQRNGLVNETRGLLVLGRARVGKTALIGRNLRRHVGITVTEGKDPGNVLYFRVSASPTLKGVATDILKKTGYGKVHSGLRSSQLWDMVINKLASLGITVLWLDEAHHMLELHKEMTDVLRRLKTLMQGDRAIALIVSGIPSLDQKIQTDEETDERFFRIRLGPMQTERELSDLKSFIERSCQEMRLEMPVDPHLVDRLSFGTSGSLGRSIECTQSAIGRALRRADGLLILDDFRRSYNLKRSNSDDGPFDPEPWPVLKDILDKKGWSE